MALQLRHFLIPAMEAGRIPAHAIIAFQFFGKPQKAKLYIDIKAVNADDQISTNVALQKLAPFIGNSAKLSKQIEAMFCKCANDYNDDPKYTGIPKGVIKHYGDIPDLIVTGIRLEETEDPKHFVVAVCGEYCIDPEHGWSVGFLDGSKPSKAVGQYMDEYYLLNAF